MLVLVSAEYPDGSCRFSDVKQEISKMVEWQKSIFTNKTQRHWRTVDVKPARFMTYRAGFEGKEVRTPINLCQTGFMEAKLIS